jgi:hypothetical protein
MLTQITNMLGLPQPAQTKDTAAPSDEGVDFGEVFVEGDQNSAPTEADIAAQDVETSSETTSEEEDEIVEETVDAPAEDPDTAQVPMALGEAPKDVSEVTTNRAQDSLTAQNRVEPLRSRRMQNMVEAARAMQKRLDAAEASKQPARAAQDTAVRSGASVAEIPGSGSQRQNRKAAPKLPIFEQKQLGAFVPEKVPALVSKVPRATPVATAQPIAPPQATAADSTPIKSDTVASGETAVGRSTLLAMAQAQSASIGQAQAKTATPRPDLFATPKAARIPSDVTTVEAPKSVVEQSVASTSRIEAAPQTASANLLQDTLNAAPRAEGQVASGTRVDAGPLSEPEIASASPAAAQIEPQRAVSEGPVPGRESVQPIPEMHADPRVATLQVSASSDELPDLDMMLARMPQGAQPATPPAVPSAPVSQPAVMAQISVPTPPPAAPVPAIEPAQPEPEAELELVPPASPKQGFAPTDMQVRVRTSAAAQKIDLRDMQPGGEFFRNANLSGSSFMEQQTEAELSEMTFTGNTTEARVQSSSYTAQAVQMTRAETAAVVRQVADQIPRLSQTGTVEIALSPEELGSVRMQMVQGESGLTVVVQAERPETLDLMRRNIDQLAQDLAEAGYENTAFEFADGDGSDQSAGQGGQGSGDQTGADAADATSLSVNPAAMNDGLDIRV